MSACVGVISPYATEEHEASLILQSQQFIETLDSEVTCLACGITRLQVTKQNRFVGGSDCRPRFINDNRTAKDDIERIAGNVRLQNRLPVVLIRPIRLARVALDINQLAFCTYRASSEPKSAARS